MTKCSRSGADTTEAGLVHKASQCQATAPRERERTVAGYGSASGVFRKQSGFYAECTCPFAFPDVAECTCPFAIPDAE
jgi:hypothetical protein